MSNEAQTATELRQLYAVDIGANSRYLWSLSRLVVGVCRGQFSPWQLIIGENVRPAPIDPSLTMRAQGFHTASVDAMVIPIAFLAMAKVVVSIQLFEFAFLTFATYIIPKI